MVKHKNYTSLFSDPAADPLGSEKAKELILQYDNDFRTQPSAPAINDLMLAVVESFKDEAIGGLATFTMERGEPMLEILTGIRRYGRTTENVGSPLLGEVFAHINDVGKSGIGSLICVDKTHFDIIHQNGVMVLEADWMEEKLSQDKSLKFIVDIKKDDDKVETIAGTQRIVYIPGRLIPFVIGRHLSPREAFLILYPQIKDKNLQKCCESLVNFLWIAATLKSTASKCAIAHKTAGVTNLSFDLALQTYMHESVILRDLPDLEPEVSTDLY